MEAHRKSTVTSLARGNGDPSARRMSVEGAAFHGDQVQRRCRRVAELPQLCLTPLTGRSWDQRSFKDFTSGNFEFGAEASAIAITAAAGAKLNTTGSSAGCQLYFCAST